MAVFIYDVAVFVFVYATFVFVGVTATFAGPLDRAKDRGDFEAFEAPLPPADEYEYESPSCEVPLGSTLVVAVFEHKRQARHELTSPGLLTGLVTAT